MGVNLLKSIHSSRVAKIAEKCKTEIREHAAYCVIFSSDRTCVQRGEKNIHFGGQPSVFVFNANTVSP